MSKTNIVIVDHRFKDLDTERAILSQIKGAQVADLRGASDQEISAACENTDAVMVGARFRLDRERIALMRRCKVIVRYGVGIDNVDVDAATEVGIWVAFVPDYCVEEVATHALAMLLSLNRGLVRWDAAVRTGRWSGDEPVKVRRLSTNTLGIVGFGRIGEALCRRAVALGMKVLAVDPQRRPRDIIEAGAEVAELQHALSVSDCLSLNASQGAGPILDRSTIAHLKRGCFVLNLGRGGLIDEDALASGLHDGVVGGAGLDVVSKEPIDPQSPLLDAPNVIVTPHVAWYSEESISELRRRAAEDVCRVLTGLPPANAVNQPARRGGFGDSRDKTTRG